MGLGDRRQFASTGLPQEVRLGHGSEWTHSPNDAKGRGKRDVSHGRVDSISSTCAWEGRFTGADESASGAIEERTRNHGCELRSGQGRARSRGFFARMNVN